MVHRLELAYKDALRECKLYNAVFNMLGNVFAFYKHYLPRASLKTAFQTLQETPGKTVKYKFCHWSHWNSGDLVAR